MSKSLIITLLCTILLCGTGWSQATDKKSPATPTPPTTPTYSQTLTTGMVGITPSDTARMNVLNLGTASAVLFAGIATSTSALTPATCSVTIEFLDGQGNVVGSQAETLGSGQAASFDFPLAKLTPAGTPPRQQIRGAVKYSYSFAVPVAAVSTIALPVNSCNLVPTLEVFNTVSGETEVILTEFITAPQVTATPVASTPAEP